MATATITGDDTLTLFDRVFTDLADGDTSAITFPNELATVKTGKNKNTIYAKNESGKNADLVLRINRGSSDDRFLQSKLASQNRDFASFTFAEGTFVKRVGDGQGNVSNEVYALRGGVFTREVDGKENVEGDTEQAVAIYNLRFAEVDRDWET